MGSFIDEQGAEIDVSRGEGKKTDTETAKCPGCGSNMVFDAESQCLLCHHCGTKKEFVTDAVAEERSLSDAFGKGDCWREEEAAVFSCDNCGAKVVLSRGETAKICPFCGTAHVRKSEELAGLKPNALIPFSISGDEAVDFSKKWAKRRFYAPRKFKKKIDTDSVKGVYTPCFTFDSYTSSVYSGRIGQTHTRVRGSGKNRRVETYVVWQNISGSYFDAFDDVLVTAGTKLDQKKLTKVMPYGTDKGRVYEEEFLLGFMAYHYDRDITECWGNAKSMIDKEIERRILSRYTYDRIAYFNVSTRHDRVTYKYIMLPVYVGNYNYNKKVYNYYVNGETGKVWGKTPLSVFKIAGTVILGLGILAALIWIFFGG